MHMPGNHGCWERQIIGGIFWHVEGIAGRVIDPPGQNTRALRSVEAGENIAVYAVKKRVAIYTTFFLCNSEGHALTPMVIISTKAKLYLWIRTQCLIRSVR